MNALVAAHPERPEAETWCAAAPSGIPRDECFFQLAERIGDVTGCQRAGAFVTDCEMHLFTRQLRSVDASVPIADYTRAVTALLATPPFDAKEPRYWSAAYRNYQEAMATPDRQPCKELVSELHRAACWNTGIAVYNDHLNRLRDRRKVDCTRSTPPEALLRPDDPELQRILEDRWPTDLCTPRP